MTRASPTPAKEIDDSIDQASDGQATCAAADARHEYDLFVVYARADKDFVLETLLPPLKLPAKRVCLVHKLQLGSIKVTAIADAVTRSRYTIAVLSRAYLQEKWEQFGTDVALYVHANDPRVIPLRLENCAIPVALQAREGLDFTDRSNWQSELDRLSQLLRAPAVPGTAPEESLPEPGRRWMWLIGSVAGTALVTGWLWLRDESMVRFSAATIHLGVFDAISRPAECSALTPEEDCAELAHPEKVEQVEVQAFELDRYEVTNGEFARWLNANANLKPVKYSIITSATNPPRPLIRMEKCGDALTVDSDGRVHVAPGTERWPVVCVSWFGADEYCRAHGKRLPLETEWELAVKGAAGRPFAWGIDLPRPDGVASALLGGGQHPRDVGSSPQDVTPDGVHDLGGNAAEWVDDGRNSSETKTLRGGSFHSPACYLLGSGCRHRNPAGYQLDIGFRCARGPIEPGRQERWKR